MTIQTYGTAGNQPGSQTLTFHDRKLLETADAVLVHTKFSTEYSIPNNFGDTIDWTRWNNLGTQTTVLIEGVTPVSSNLSVSLVSATVAEYGNWVLISNKLLKRSRDNVKYQAAERLGVQAGESVDAIDRDVKVAGSSVFYANGGASRATLDVSNIMTPEDIARAVTLLKTNMARPLKNGKYGCIFHPHTTFTLRQQSEWRDVYKQSPRTDIFEGHEVRECEGAYIVETTMAKIWSGGGALGTTGARNDGANYDVYGTLLFGGAACGTVDLAKTLRKMIWKELGSAGTGDPINQRASAAWYAEFVSKILNDSFMTRIEHTNLI